MVTNGARFYIVRLDNHLIRFPALLYSQLIPKLSASVNISLASPDHCFVILPTEWTPSAESTLKEKGGEGRSYTSGVMEYTYIQSPSGTEILMEGVVEIHVCA